MPVQQAGEFAETGEYDIIFIDIPGSMDVRSRSLADYLQCGIILCNDYDMSMAINILGQLLYYCLIFLVYFNVIIYTHLNVCIKVNHIAMLIILILFIPKQLALRGHYRIEWISCSYNLIIYFVMSLSTTSLSAGNHSTLSSVSAVSQRADLCSRNSISSDATLHK